MPPGSAIALETRRDVDAVAEDVVVLDDHVAEIDADAIQHALPSVSALRCAIER